MIRQVPELIEEDYQLVTEDLPRSTWVEAIAFYNTYGAKLGDFTANYFILLKIFELSLSLMEGILENPEYDREVQAGCYILALYLAIHMLSADLLLWIPAEVAEQTADYLHGLISEYNTSENSLGIVGNIFQFFKNIFKKFIFYSALYISFGMQSVTSSDGALALFPNNLPGKIAGITATGLITELGIFYCHIVYYPKIKTFVKFAADVVETPRVYLSEILKHPLKSLQVIKSFTIISVYYASLGVFYLYSLSELLSEKLEFPINGHQLNIAMGFAGGLVLFSTVVLRFRKTVDKYFSNASAGMQPQDAALDAFLECLISAAGLTLSSRHYTKNRLMAIGGIIASLSSLVIGLSTVKTRRSEAKALLITESVTDPEIKPEEISGWAKWLNAHSRFVKSTYLPYSAIEKITVMLMTNSHIDLGLDRGDIFCLMVIIGVYNGMNNTNMWLPTINSSIKHLKVKFQIVKEDKDSNCLSWIFKPTRKFSPEFRLRLEASLRSTP